MQLKSLKVFCDVASRRSFSRAADDNGISQSGASQVVHQLEEHLGVKLIDRSKRPFVLTPEGETYYEGCRKIVQRYFALEERVRSLHEEIAGKLRIISIYSVGLHHLTGCREQFLRQYPKAEIRVEYAHPRQVIEAITEDEADLGLLSYPKSSRSLQVIRWRVEPMVFVCAPEHRLAGASAVALEDLAGESLVTFDADLPIRRHIDRVLEQHGADVAVAMEFDNIESIKRAIEINAGVGLLPSPTVAREVKGGTLVAVSLASDDLVRPIGIVHRRGKELSVTAKRFIDLLQSGTQDVAVRDNERRGEGEPGPMVSPQENGNSAGEESASNGRGGAPHGRGDAPTNGHGVAGGARRAIGGNGHELKSQASAKVR